MKGFFSYFLICVIFTPFCAFANKNNSTSPIVVAVLSGESKSDFEAKIEPLLKDQLKICSNCSFQNVTPYNSDGQFDLKRVPEKLEQAANTVSFIFFNWNGKSTSETKPIVDSLKKIVASGKLVVASAGAAKEAEPTLPLSRTIVGEVKEIVIVGDMGERERLHTASYFGPEMLTAVKPPVKEYVGQGYGPLFFASRLATNWNKKNNNDWAPYFQDTKSKTRKIWPNLDDFFGRK